MVTFEEKLKEFALKIGIDLIGITTAEPFYEAYVRLKKMKDKGYLSPWVEKNISRRCNPQLIMPDACSIIAVGMSYHVTDDFSGEGDMLKGKLARFAMVRDYHLVLKEKMEELISFIKKEYPEIKTKIFVDTGPLIDREVAYRAGLGFIGRNSFLINPDYGSFIALGEILLNIPLKPDKPIKNQCLECDLCIKSCPRQAIKAPREIQAKDCLSHYTQEKGFLPTEVRKDMGTNLWGCDECQEVCPFNQKAKKGSGIFSLHKAQKLLDLEKIVSLSSREFKELIEETPIAWRGRTTLQRNALINLGNLGDKRAIPVLKKALQDERPLIRGIAAWAIGQFNTSDARDLLKKALHGEKNSEVINEINDALRNMEVD